MAPTHAAPVVTLRGVGKAFGTGTLALDGLDLDIRDGEFLSLLGPSGCGKSTALRIVAGLGEPTRGTVSWSSPEARKGLGFVFQEGLLLPELTARENVAMPLMLNGAHRKAAEQTAARWLESLGLAGMGDHRPGELSGGQRQRVAIARAQAVEPDVVFADEPTGALDSDTSDAVLASLISSTVSRGRTLVVVTHDPSVAAACSRLVRVRDGRIESDTAQRPAQPASEGTVR